MPREVLIGHELREETFQGKCSNLDSTICVLPFSNQNTQSYHDYVHDFVRAQKSLDSLLKLIGNDSDDAIN